MLEQGLQGKTMRSTTRTMSAPRMKEVHGNTAYMEKDKRKAYKMKAYRRKQKYTNKAYGRRTGIHEEEEEPCTKTKN